MGSKLEAIRLRDAVDEFWARNETSLKPNTVLTWKPILERMVARFGGHRWLSEVTIVMCERAFTDRDSPVLVRADGQGMKAPNTINVARSAWCAFFTYARAREWITKDPMILVKRRTTERRKDKLFLDLAEIRYVISLADKYLPHRILLILQASSGLRISEAAGVRYKDVHLAGDYFHARIWKTNQRVRMDIPEELAAALREWLPIYASMVGDLKPHYPLIPTLCNFHWHKEPDGTVAKGDFWGVRWTKNRTSPKPMAPLLGGRIVKSYLVRGGWDIDREASHVIRRSAGQIVYDLVKAEGGDARALEAAAAFLNHLDMTTTLEYIGRESGKEQVTKLLAGRPFLSLGQDDSNVLHLGARRG